MNDAAVQHTVDTVLAAAAVVIDRATKDRIIHAPDGGYGSNAMLAELCRDIERDLAERAADQPAFNQTAHHHTLADHYEKLVKVRRLFDKNDQVLEQRRASAEGGAP